MFYKIIILSLLLSVMAFGTGMVIKNESIKNFSLLRVIFFWLIILSAKAGEITTNYLLTQYNQTQLKNIATVITFCLGIALIIRSKSEKAAAVENMYHFGKIFPLIYTVFNTYLIIASFTACGITFKHAPLVVSLLELLFISLGIGLKRQLPDLGEKSFETWYCLCGALVMFMVVVYFI